MDYMDREYELLVTLRECLVQMLEGKITEKKKHIDKLKLLLKKDVILRSLDKSSSLKTRNEQAQRVLLTWTRVFSYVKSYIQQEAERIEERETAMQNPSATVKANRDKEKKTCSELFKFIVSVISTRHQSGACGKILDHLLTVLTNKFTLDAFGLDYTNVLLKEVLPSLHMCLEIKCDTFEDLIKLYCKFIKKPPSGWDRNVLAQTVHQLLISAYNQHDVNPHFLMQFFIYVFDSTKNEKATRFHEHLLHAVILVCQNVHVSGRLQLCVLGESIILPLIHLWKSKPTDTTKELMLEFFLVQLALHHPKGAENEETGAFAADWSTWKSLLINMYRLVVKELTEVCEKNKYTSKELVLHPYFIAVAAEVCAQVFQDACAIIEVTQLPETYESSSVIKKRRIDVGFRAFIEALKSYSSSSQIIPWLQLVSEVLRKYCRIVSLHEIAIVINMLIEIHLSCNQIEVKTWLLTACQAAVEAFCAMKNEASQSEVEAVVCDWNRLWELGVKCVALMHQCHDAGHRLLSTLLMNKLVTPKTEFFNLYRAGSNNKVSGASLRTLAIYLQKFSLSTSASLQLDVVSGSQLEGNGIRNQLLNWMCLATDMSTEECNLISLLSSKEVDACTIEYFSEIVPYFFLQDYKFVSGQIFNQVANSRSGVPSWIENLENDLLLSSFDLPFIPSTSTLSKVPSLSGALHGNHASAWKNISVIVLGILNKFSEGMPSSECFVTTQLKLGCLVFLILRQLCLHGVLLHEDLTSSSIVNNLKSLLDSSLNSLSVEASTYKSGTPSIDSVLKEALPFVSIFVKCLPSSKEEPDLLCKMSLSCFPSSLPAVLLDVVSIDCNEKNNASLSSNIRMSDESFNGGPSNSRIVMDIDDDIMSKPKPRQRKNRYDASVYSDVDELDISMDTVDNSCTTSANAFSNPMEELSTSELSKVQAEYADVLILLSSKTSSEPKLLNFLPHSFAKKILNFISLKKDSKKPEDIHLVLKLLKSALLVKNLCSEDIPNVLSVIRSLLNKHSKCRKICVGIISLFPSLYPHLFGDLVISPSLSTEKKHVMHLLQKLCDKEQENQCNQDVSFALAEVLNELIKHEPGIQWNEQKDNIGDETQSVVADYSQFLKSKNFKVRSYVSSNVRSLYDNVEQPLNADGNQKQFFENISLLKMPFSPQLNSEVSHPGRTKDEEHNLSTCMLHFLCHTYIEYSQYQKQIIFIMCQMIKNREVSEDLVIKVLLQISKFLGYPTLFDFMEPHFSHLCCKWLESRYKIDHFPARLFQFDSLHSFLQNFYSKLIPFLFYYLDMESIRFIAAKLNTEVRELIIRCLPQCLAHIISWLTIDLMHDKAHLCLNTLEENVTCEAVLIALGSQMDDIAICLLNMLGDEENEPMNSRGADNSCCPSIITPLQFVSTTDILREKTNCKMPFVKYLCLQQQDSLQKIMLALQIKISKSYTFAEEKLALLMCQTIIELILSELKSRVKNYHSFLLTEIVHTLVNFVVERYHKSNVIALGICIDLLQKLFEHSLPLCKEEIGNLLPYVVSRLTLFISDSKVAQKIASLLNYLIIKCSRYFEEYVVCLDPFPDAEYLQEIRKLHLELMYKNGPYTLEMEFDHFTYSYKMTGRATVEGLKHLCMQLRKKKTELHQTLINLQENKLFSEDIKNSKLHSLICILLTICTPGNSSKEIQEEASRCLGEIGAVNLSATILQTEHLQSERSGNGNTKSVFYKAYSHILTLLHAYLIDKRVKVKVITCQVVKNLFKTATAKKFLLSYEEAHSQIWFKYLYPFQSQKKVLVGSSKNAVNDGKIDQVLLWAPDEGNYAGWITELVCTILTSGVSNDEFFEELTPVCQEEPAFCSQILPYVIHAVIMRGDLHLQEIISLHISSFFAKLSKQLEDKPTSRSSTPLPSNEPPESFYSCKAAVQTMLSVVNYLRLQVKPEEDSDICPNCFTGLRLDYLHVAQAAQYCSAYFTAILFTELWCDSVRSNIIAPTAGQRMVLDQLVPCSPDSSPMTILNTQDQTRVALVYKILLDAYSKIGDVDGVHGCIEIAADMQSVVQNHYVAENKWDQLLSYYDKEDDPSGIFKALKNCGLDNTLQSYLKSCSNINADMSAIAVEYQCECLSKLGQWDIHIPNSEKPKFQESFYKSLKCLQNKNKAGFIKHLELSRSAVFQSLSHSSLESLRSIMPVLSNLQMLVLIEDYSSIFLENGSLHPVQEKWKKQKILPYADFEFFEPVSWLQCIVLKQYLDSRQYSMLDAVEFRNCMEEHAVVAREESCLQAASRAVDFLRKSTFGNQQDSLRWEVEEAKILWKKKEHLVANRLLKSVLLNMEKIVKGNPDDFDFLLTYAKTLSLRGKWLGDTCSENSTTIMKDYLEKAIDVIENAEYLQGKEFKLWDAYLAVARYADSQYQNIVNYKRSTSYQTKQELMVNATEAVNKINAKRNLTGDEQKTKCILVRQRQIDADELKSLDSDQQQFLMKAIASYLICLRGTDCHDLWVFRLTALWFHNLGDDNINTAIKKNIEDIETYKFLPLMYQLAARMGTQTTGQFADVLTQLIKKITIDHPHHALPIILSMSNADKDPTENKASRKKNTSDAGELSRKERTVAAKKLVADLTKTKLSTLLWDMSSLCDAYISLAYMSADEAIREKKRIVDIPQDESIMKIKNLANVPVITETVKVDRSRTYSNIIGIHSFHSEFRLCGGVNVPKVIKCIGTDGVGREQLVKGRDDLRQDAVMQQVFSLVNCLLKENIETKKRKLHIKTYKVIPMSQRSGVLQWCEGTQVLSQYLIGPVPSGGAHKKYYPNFWLNLQCQKTMKTIAEFSSVRKKREVYDEICKNYPPVFRYFFFEKFPEPSAWFERQQSYTKSVAASSIVGYILGLGDRHVNNILIDKYTAEIVHIDFGIAFEKGRILQTPETVPFRLTRDVVDGMGFIGVEGVFKRCCEKTMEVMRNSQDVLLTILEVLLYDPLYDWTVPTTKSSLSTPQMRSEGSSSEGNSGQAVNKLAERALMRLQQKLQGLEEGMTLSISGHVNLLIQQARDPDNLCRLYAGWQPYL